MTTDDAFFFFDWDWGKYNDIEVPFVVRHPNGTAQVVSDRNEAGRPMRVPGFLLSKKEADDLSDKEILIIGLEFMRRLDIQLSTTKSEYNGPDGLKVESDGNIIPSHWIKHHIYNPPKVLLDNKFDIQEGFWNAFNDSGRFMFNFLYEFLERNETRVFATDIFKMEEFTNQQIVTVQKIINAAKFNICIVAAEFISTGQDNYDDDGNFNPENQNK